jgi:hypothetical protein
MEPGTMGTNGKLVWEQNPGRLLIDGEAVGKKFITTIQNYPGWRCIECHLMLFDYGRVI